MLLHDGSGFRQLQAHLSAARLSLKAGALDEALARVDAALEIDPQYLAALALRDKIVAAKLPPTVEASSPEVSASPVSIESFAKFEERARRRRVERRLETARAAIRAGQIGEARAALGEVSSLEPELPELRPANQDLARAEERARAIPSRGPWFAAGVAAAAVLLGAVWHELPGAGSQAQPSAPALPPIASAATVAGAAPLVDPLPPPLFDVVPTMGTVPVEASLPLATPGDTPSAPKSVPGEARAARDAAPPIPRVDRPVDVPARLTPPVDTVPVATTLVAPIARPALPPPAPSEPRATIPPVATAPAPAAELRARPMTIAPPSEDRLVRDTLQRYRSAYDGLNARSAQEVWPTVDEPALARAFDGLESQSLTFDDCAVELRGVIATATCRGSARFTPKTGSREPHVEPRVWNFTLSKTDSRWQIDSARVAR